MRISSVVPFGVDHQVNTHDIYVKSGKDTYRIPKRTAIGYNVKHIQQTGDCNNKEHWIKTGMQIYLNNWLYKNKNNEIKFKLNESFVSFGIGRRDCVGKTLAIKELSIIIGHLLMNYQFELHNKNQTLKYSTGITSVVDPPIPIKIKRFPSNNL